MIYLASFIINVLGNIGYLNGVVRGRYQPERATWFIWTSVLSVAFFSYYTLGAKESLWFLGGDLLVSAGIAVASLKYGVGGLNRLDIMMGSLAGIGLLVWLLFNSPLVALLCALFADICGVVPTMLKSVREPRSESAWPYAASSVSALIGVYLVGQWSVTLFIYPLYLFIANGVVALTVAVGRYHTSSKSCK